MRLIIISSLSCSDCYTAWAQPKSSSLLTIHGGGRQPGPGRDTASWSADSCWGVLSDPGEKSERYPNAGCQQAFIVWSYVGRCTHGTSVGGVGKVQNGLELGCTSTQMNPCTNTHMPVATHPTNTNIHPHIHMHFQQTHSHLHIHTQTHRCLVFKISRISQEPQVNILTFPDFH